MSAAESPRHVDGGSDPETPVPGTPNNLGDSSSNGADVVADSVPDGVTQSNGTAAVDNRGSASAEDSKGRRRIRPPTDAPDWLPIGWIVEDRVRTSGATAGSVDKYYCAPVSKHVFRSKNEVLHYVQTGTRLKRKKNVDSPDGEAMDANGSGGRKQKKAAVPSAPPTLDFENVPTVTWVLKDRAKDSWVPHMDGHEVEGLQNGAEMLVNLNIPWAILGHSERRLLLKEWDESLLVWERLLNSENQGPLWSTMTIVAAQRKTIAEEVSNWDNIVSAYEPIWAIGTGKVATPAQAHEVHLELRKWIKENDGSEVAASVRRFCKWSKLLRIGCAALKPEFIDIIKSATMKESD